MMAVIGLINVSGFIHAWKAQWYDGLFSIITFLATLITPASRQGNNDRRSALGRHVSLQEHAPKVTTLSMHEDSSFQSASDHGLKECRILR